MPVSDYQVRPWRCDQVYLTYSESPTTELDCDELLICCDELVDELLCTCDEADEEEADMSDEEELALDSDADDDELELLNAKASLDDDDPELELLTSCDELDLELSSSNGAATTPRVASIRCSPKASFASS